MANNPAENLRRQYEGKIIFMSSVAGLITDPFAGTYSSSKHALEAVAPPH
ncbi:SDR family NAD(P)-dependent oxidoreductase [Kozakia baliensis]